MQFGEVIAAARKKLGLSQKELAARIKKEDGAPISAPYLNDIEHNRRYPPSGYLLRQLARELNLPVEYLLFYAGQYPKDIRGDQGAYAPKDVEAAFRAFRKALKGK